MTVSEANEIINRVRNENGFGLLEMLEIMHDEHEAGHAYWIQTYNLEERTAYHVLMNGFYDLFHGAQ